MELVRGVPIAEYCDKHNMTTRERLKLFITVCRAVQHAHQKGIIHRDIKPGNVLVTRIDGKAVPKVIDFGVAKATGPQSIDQSVYTQFAEMIGTPLYMSPEQAEMSGVDVDTRSDVYSLGVVLYELLTGRTPFDRETLKQANPVERLRIIREDEPPKPSARLSTLNAAVLDTISAQRGTDSAKLNQTVRGELDWIVMRALEKDRNRRYESASALAADVERYLSDQPVQAGPPSAWYRFGKFARRKKGVLVTSLVVALSLISGTAISVWQAFDASAARELADERADAANESYRAELDARRQAERGRKLARQAVDEMYTRFSEDILRYSPRLEDVHRQFLLKALEFYESFSKESGDDPEIRRQAGMALLHVAEIHSQLGMHTKAERYCRLAIARLESAGNLSAGERDALAQSLNQLAALLYEVGSNDEAESRWRQAVSVVAELAAAFPDEPRHRWHLATYEHNLAIVLARKGDHKKALALARKASESLAELVRVHPDVARYRRDLGKSYTGLGLRLEETGDVTEAKKMQLLALATYEKLKSGKVIAVFDLHAIAVIHQNLGILYAREKHFEQAEKEFRTTIKMEQTAVDNFPRTIIYQHTLATAHRNLALVLENDGRPRESIAPLQAAVRIWSQIAELPGASLNYAKLAADSCDNLGRLLVKFDQPDKAIEVFHQGLLLQEQVIRNQPEPKYRQLLARRWFNYAKQLSKRDKAEPAEKAFHAALKVFSKLAKDFPSDPLHRRDMARCHNTLAVHLAVRDRLKQAVRNWREALRLDPRHPSAKSNLRKLFAKHPELQGNVKPDTVRRDKSSFQKTKKLQR